MRSLLSPIHFPVRWHRTTECGVITYRNESLQGINCGLFRYWRDMMAALAMEVPVVSTSVSGIPELIQHEETGLLVPGRDPVALAEAMACLARHQHLCQKPACQVRIPIENEYDIFKNAARLAELFQQAVEERGE